MLIEENVLRLVKASAVSPPPPVNEAVVAAWVTLLSVLLGTTAGGILGALIAIPVTACLQILVRDFYTQRDLAVPSVTKKVAKI